MSKWDLVRDEDAWEKIIPDAQARLAAKIREALAMNETPEKKLMVIEWLAVKAGETTNASSPEPAKHVARNAAHH